MATTVSQSKVVLDGQCMCLVCLIDKCICFFFKTIYCFSTHRLSKSLSPRFLAGVQFFTFALGDRAYGPQFCAAGRKWTVRCLQLGATLWSRGDGGGIGYGDDGTAGGGVLRDLDEWITQELQPVLLEKGFPWNESRDKPKELAWNIPYKIISTNNCQSRLNENDIEEKSPNNVDLEHLSDFFQHQGPLTAYHYKQQQQQQQPIANGKRAEWSIDSSPAMERPLPLLATVTANQRLTTEDWEQDTRHLTLVINDGSSSDADITETSTIYRAGDVVSIMPINADAAVERFLSLLPASIQSQADNWLEIQYQPPQTTQGTSVMSIGVAYPHWPRRPVTLRQWLTYCADFQALPEREDLWTLAQFCNLHHERGADQRDKLVSLSEATASALYTDYILRQKRTWADVLYDFDSLRYDSNENGGDQENCNGSNGKGNDSGHVLTIEALISLLAPMRPREFSIASSPTKQVKENGKFAIDLTVAVVQGTTPLGRFFHGLCSTYLAKCAVGDKVRLWIRPGSFGALPVSQPAVPVAYMGAGTGIAPLRGLIQERMVHAKGQTAGPLDSTKEKPSDTENLKTSSWPASDILLFGCRKESTDFYYKDEWEILVKEGSLTLLTAFSRDQWHKFYVQQRLKQDDPQGLKLLHHLVTQQGHLYIAGGAKMARSLKDEIVELLDPHLGGKATAFLAQLQRAGRFRVEAWS